MDEILKYLICPTCKSALKSRKGYLLCRKCCRQYPVKEGIPILLDSLSKQEEKQHNYFNKHQVMTERTYTLEEWHKSFLRRFGECFDNLKEKIILDGGTGEGYMTIELARRGVFVIACDIAYKGLLRLKKIAKENGLERNILCVCCSLENMPFKEKTVDIFLLNAILEHLENEKGVISEVARILKNHSGVMVTVPLKYRFMNPFFVPSSIWQDKMIGHLRRYDENDVLNKFKIYGFKKIKTYYSGHFLKVIFTKFIIPIFSSNRLIKKIEEIDSQREAVKYGASNLCVLLKK